MVGRRLDRRREIRPSPLVDICLDGCRIDLGRSRRRSPASSRTRPSGSRYEWTVAWTAWAAWWASKPRYRAATTRLAASRFTSHSQGPGMGLVEVVHVEQRGSVRVTRTTRSSRGGRRRRAGPEPARRRRRQVGRHRQRRAAIERERRERHPAVADRHEIGDPRRRLALEERDRVGPVGGRLPVGVRRCRETLARRPGPGRCARHDRAAGVSVMASAIRPRCRVWRRARANSRPPSMTDPGPPSRRPR